MKENQKILDPNSERSHSISSIRNHSFTDCCCCLIFIIIMVIFLIISAAAIINGDINKFGAPLDPDRKNYKNAIHNL